MVAIDEWRSKCWINIICPTQADKDYIINDLRVPLDFFYDIEDDDERPRIEIEDGWTLIIMRIPMKRDETMPFATIPLGIVMRGDVIASICFHNNDVITDFILYTQRKSIYIDNNYNFLLRLFLSSSVWFQKYLKQININIKMAEKELERSIKNEDLQTLLKIEKSLVFFITSLKGNNILFSKLKNIKNAEFDEELLEDVEIELRQAMDTTNVHSDILAGTMDAYASIISNNVNDIMKKLTSITVVLMIPTLIASLYGMNVQNKLEGYEYGFIVITIVAVIFTLLGVIFLKRRNLL